jgi:serine/threonine-protein kinase
MVVLGLALGAKVAVVAPAPAEPPRVEGREEIRPEFGTLALSAQLDGVEVWLGDQRVGETRAGRALIVNNVPTGTHRLTARKDGHKEWTREVQVTANQRAELVINIEALGPQKVVKGDDGAKMVLVPTGEFWMGSDQTELDRFVDACKRAGTTMPICKQWSQIEAPRHRVYLDAFHVDQHEVTNAQFERFVRATSHQTTAEQEGTGLVHHVKDGAWQTEELSGVAWRTPTGPRTSASHNHPVVQVSWSDADAYCRWAGKRLPTEAEWEKAARGTDGRRYPWGETWSASRANGGRNVGATRPVGSYASGMSPYEAHDMAGNVLEWVADWWNESYYQRSPERNPRGPDSGQYRILRGGSWLDLSYFLRPAYRHVFLPGYRSDGIGFRCARGASE